MILFMHRESLVRIFMWLMGFGILILLDNLATIWLASLIGAFVAVALVGVLTWVNLSVVFAAMARHIRLARLGASRGTMAKTEFIHLSSLTVSAILIISPGLITDLLAWLLFLPPLRIVVGTQVFRRFKTEFEQLHQHLSTEEL